MHAHGPLLAVITAWRMNDKHETLQQLWLKHVRGIGVDKPSMRLLSMVVAAWSQPHRRYHNLRHLQECLHLLERWGRDEPARHEIGVALWFHDAVYDPKRDDNEDRSARWATRALRELEAPDATRRRVAKLIRATAHSNSSTAGRALNAPGTALLLDIDLAILGADRARFEEYERQVRLEYGHVQEREFAQVRASLLRSLLSGPIFRTDPAHAELEVRARENLLRSLDRWQAASSGDAMYGSQ